MNRRELFERSVGGALSLAALSHARQASAAETPPASQIIDTHTHFFDPSRPEGVPWPGKDDKALYRTMLPPDYAKISVPLGVTGTVVVEASPRLEDNQWLLDLAEKEKLIKGIVGNLNPGSEGYRGNVARFAKNKFFRGIRINHDPLKKGLGERQFLADVKLLAEHDLQLDVNGGPDMPADVARLAELAPELRIVINHVANVRIDGQAPPPAWRDGMAAAASRENVYCKVSALVEGAAQGDRKVPIDPAFYRPVLDVVWELFGANRLIYGSNWPVSERYAPYATVQQVAADYFRTKGEAACENFFWRNSLAAYKWVQRD